VYAGAGQGELAGAGGVRGAELGSHVRDRPPGAQESGGFCEFVASFLPGTQTQPGRITAIRRFFSDNQTRTNVSVAVVSYGTNPR
jgi:hypothetical protein